MGNLRPQSPEANILFFSPRNSAIPGTPTTPPETCNPMAPAPTQPTAVCGCRRWHQVAGGNTCDGIVARYGITLANFHKWNPGVGSDCKSLWVPYYVCVGV